MFLSFTSDKNAFSEWATNHQLHICHMFQEEGLRANSMGILNFLLKYKDIRNMERRPGSVRPTKTTAAVKTLVE